MRQSLHRAPRTRPQHSMMLRWPSGCVVVPIPRDLMRPFPASPMRMWPISTRVNKPENDEPSILEAVELASFRLQLDHLALEPRDLQLLRLHPTLAGECLLRIVAKCLHPIAQLRRMYAQILRCLRIRDPAISDQPNSLKLELSRVNLRLSMTHLQTIKTPNSVSAEPG